MLHPGFISKPGHSVGAQGVVLDGFVGAVFHERDMLVRRRMVDDLGPVLCEDTADTVLVRDTADQHHKIHVRIVFLQLQLDFIGCILIDIKQDQLLRGSGGNLAGQFGTDGTAGPGNHDRLAGQVIHDLVVVDLDLIPAEQVFQADITQLGNGHRAGIETIQARYNLQTAAGILAYVEDLAAVMGGYICNRENDEADIVFLYQFRNIIAAALDADAFEVPALLERAVVHDGPDAVLAVLAHADIMDNLAGCLAGADEQDIFIIPAAGITGPEVVQEAVGEPDQHTEEQAEDITDCQAAAGDKEIIEEIQADRQDADGNISHSNSVDFRDAGKAPDAVVQTVDVVQDEGCRDDDHQEVCHVVDVPQRDLTDRELKPDPERRAVRNKNGDDI